MIDFDKAINSIDDAESAHYTSSTEKNEGLFYLCTIEEVHFNMTYMSSKISNHVHMSINELGCLYICRALKGVGMHTCHYDA